MLLVFTMEHHTVRVYILPQDQMVPYTGQASNVASLSEQGFKEMRGALTEGRYVRFWK